MIIRDSGQQGQGPDAGSGTVALTCTLSEQSMRDREARVPSAVRASGYTRCRPDQVRLPVRRAWARPQRDATPNPELATVRAAYITGFKIKTVLNSLDSQLLLRREQADQQVSQRRPCRFPLQISSCSTLQIAPPRHRCPPLEEVTSLVPPVRPRGAARASARRLLRTRRRICGHP